MSTAELFIGQDGNGDFVVVDISKAAAQELFERLLESMKLAAPEYIPQFEGEYAGGVMSISGLQAEAFVQVSQIIMQACSTAVLQPFNADLKTALEADLRFKNAAI